MTRNFHRVLCISLFISFNALANEPQRIISLSPHLTELTFALNSGDKLVAVSDYSDYPEQAKQLPSVASFQGVNFEAVMRLKPDLILAWRGGNKPQDLSRLQSLGFKLFYSSPQKPGDIADEIEALGESLNQSRRAKTLAADFRQQLVQIKNRYSQQTPVSTFYYMWPTPLMTVGPNAWASKLLNICGATNIFAASPTDYPEVPMEQVLTRKPQLIIAAQKTNASDIQAFWQKWLPMFSTPRPRIAQVDPDRLHRFTPRLINGLNGLCETIHL
ncbi:cobalamin-binding protein [Neptunicella marina]|uniref:Cobalamin-binding protein n=1 Tax=Neptunicella marina TaxID=2125989 RepID=A0A8J6M143_9ALTE|nr:cobalamin-binding protein [Neptunicella marina]MBC3765187.1 cobalamin-binding protein [Neptunicella marina]